MVFKDNGDGEKHGTDWTEVFAVQFRHVLGYVSSCVPSLFSSILSQAHIRAIFICVILFRLLPVDEKVPVQVVIVWSISISREMSSSAGLQTKYTNSLCL